VLVNGFENGSGDHPMSLSVNGKLNVLQFLSYRPSEMFCFHVSLKFVICSVLYCLSYWR